MATHPADRQVPRLMAAKRWARNGLAPDGKALRKIGSAMTHCAAYRKKTIAEKMLNVANLPVGLSGGPNAEFYFGSHVGHNVTRVGALVNLAGAKFVTATDPYCVFVGRDGFSGGVVITSEELHYGWIDHAAGDVPSEMSWGNLMILDVDPDTDYRFWFRLYDRCRIISFCAFELGDNPVDDTLDGCVDPNVGVGARVHDERVAQYLQAGTKLWRDDGQQVLNFIPDCCASSPTHSGTTWTNPFDGSVAVAATSNGFQPSLLYHNSLSQTQVPCRIAVRAERTAGGGAIGDNQVRVTDGTYHLTVSNIDAAGWYTGSGMMPATAAQKWDIQFRTNASDTIRVDSVCVWEED